ncbi:MAG: Gfo/Idh/MocA family oxidoreductase [Bacteroidales bacterium]|nr:Gfo/Idh/MocA family oxidoreductase [Bacteroidales bacterium]
MQKANKTKITRRKFVDTSVKATLFSSVAISGFPTIIPASVIGKNPPSDKINIGWIGCGRQGRGDIAGTMRFDTAIVVAVNDVDSNRMALGKKMVEDYYTKKTGNSTYVNVKTYGDYKEMLLDKSIDALMITTPDHWHSQPAIEAALAGKDIYLEKPTSLTIAEGRLLSDVVRQKKVILQVGTQQRSSPQWRIAAELVRNGRIGKLHTVKIGLPGDPSGPEALEMPVPKNLNYDMWIGSTPEVYYTEIRVHPQKDFDRPGWLRCEQFGAGMITGWGQHHFDSAAWGMDTELTGPVSIEAVAAFPKSGLWDVHGDFMAKAEYKNGITQLTSGGYPNGVRYEGTEGWIFVTRGNYTATASDPVVDDRNAKALDASDPKILKSVIGENEIHLYVSESQQGNWLDCIKSRKEPISPVEIGHRACTVCLVTYIAMKLGRKLTWDPDKERFVNDAEANSMLSRPQRAPYGTNYIKI